MPAQAIFDDLVACGIAPRLTPDGRGIALPAGQLNPAQRVAITANKAALIEFLRTSDSIDQAPPTPKKALAPDPGHARLLALVLAYCDRTGVSDKARAQWLQDVEGTPPELRGDLRQYLLEQLPPPPPSPPAPHPAPAPAPSKPMGWLHLDQPWRIADRAYQNHHWQCPQCMAAARAAPGTASRCTAGQHLHDAYTSTAVVS